jgi:hypothetical protein
MYCPGLVLLGMMAIRRGTFFGKDIILMRSPQGGDLPFNRFS